MISRVKGTQDFLDLTLYNFTIDQIKKQLKAYHFTQISTPILEYTDLFKRSLGLETDVVTKEMFTIEPRKESSEHNICLRPEATAATVRAFIEHHIDQTPWKVFSLGPMFRYERPQKGRYRQFHQVNIEIIGSASISEDVQLIKMLDRLFHERLSLNNYALLINFLGCFDDRHAYRELLKEFLDSVDAQDLCKFCVDRKEKNIMRVFDCKNEPCQVIFERAPFLVDNLCKECTNEWSVLQEQLELLSVSFKYKPTLVRGLDYYNKTVFEFVSDELGAQNAFCGGGRYDQLVGQLGAKEDQPSIGAAIGLERLLLLVEQIRDRLPIPQEPALQVIIPLTQDQELLALLLADELHAADLQTDVFLSGSPKSMMRKANKLGAKYALILGPDEQKNKQVTVKNMIIGQEKTIPQTELISYLMS